MNIVTSDNSLAWTISDDTSGSGKMKRVAKPKAAPVTHDVLTTHITKYLSDSAKFENNNSSRQLALQEQQVLLDKRKMDLMERQQLFAERQHQQQYERPPQQYNSRQHDFGYQNPYGRSAPDKQHYARQEYKDPYEHSYYDEPYDAGVIKYHDHRYGRPAPDQEQYDMDRGWGPPPRERTAQELIDRRWCGYGSTYDRLAQNYQRDSNGRAVGHHTALQTQALGEIHARNGSYKENCEVMSMDGTVSKPTSSTKFYSPVHHDDSYSSHYRSIPTNSAMDLTGDGNILI